MELHTWEMAQLLQGPVSVQKPVHLTEPKGRGFLEPFYSNILIRKHQHGLRIELTALGADRPTARKAALTFLSQAIDMLCFMIDETLFLGLHAGATGIEVESEGTRRVITTEEFHEAFGRARAANDSAPAFLRGLSWYRKGLCTEDPLDAFLAWWNAMECLAMKYNPPLSPEVRDGSKSRLAACFRALDARHPLEERYPEYDWVKDYYNVRNDIAHGLVSIEVSTIEKVMEMTPSLREVCHRFLRECKNLPGFPQGQL